MHAAVTSQPDAGPARTGRCGFAGPRETILAVPQWDTGEMRRPLTAHHMLTLGRRMATEPSPVPIDYSCPGEICKTEQSANWTHMSIGSESSPATFSTYPHVIAGVCARREVNRDPRETGGRRWTGQPTGSATTLR